MPVSYQRATPTQPPTRSALHFAELTLLARFLYSFSFLLISTLPLPSRSGKGKDSALSVDGCQEGLKFDFEFPGRLRRSLGFFFFFFLFPRPRVRALLSLLASAIFRNKVVRVITAHSAVVIAMFQSTSTRAHITCKLDKREGGKGGKGKKHGARQTVKLNYRGYRRTNVNRPRKSSTIKRNLKSEL